VADLAGDAESRPLSLERYRVTIGDQSLTVEIVERQHGLFVRVDDGPERPAEVIVQTNDGELSVLLDGIVLRALIGESDAGRTVVLYGQGVDLTVLDERAARLASAAAAGRPLVAEAALRAPMPGLVVAVNVQPGQAVSKGTTLVVLSAMKMQNELTAPADAVVKEVLVSDGQTVDQNQVLVTLE